MPDRVVYSVTELNTQLKQLLEDQYSSVWLEGEISNFKHHSSGHMYFSLKDADSEIRAVMFRGLNQSLRFRPEDGLKVLVEGDVTVYLPRGQYQILVSQMQPAGAGELQLAFEQLKERLREEGLFDEVRKRPLPPYPMTIGVVTSETGAAFRDILDVLRRRAPYIRVVLAPARVQGEGAAEEIVAGIRRLNEFEGIDVIIAGRGGGSLEDLWPFNEEIVARAIVASDLPVVSAVGHEVDFSISDFCSDYRAPTPSAAAEVIARDTQELLAELDGYATFFKDRLKGKIDRLRSRLKALETHYAFRMPGQRLMTISQRVDELQTNMESRVVSLIREGRQQLESYEKQLHLLHPGQVLKRGFSITRNQDGEIVRSVENLDVGDQIHTDFHRGNAISEVRSIGVNDNDS